MPVRRCTVASQEVSEWEIPFASVAWALEVDEQPLPGLDHRRTAASARQGEVALAVGVVADVSVRRARRPHRASCAHPGARPCGRRDCCSQGRWPWVTLPGLSTRFGNGSTPGPVVDHVGDHDPHRLVPGGAPGVVGARGLSSSPVLRSLRAPVRARRSSRRPTRQGPRARGTSPWSGRCASCAAHRRLARLQRRLAAEPAACTRSSLLRPRAARSTQRSL